MKFTDKQLKLLDERYVRGGDLKNAYMHVSHSSHGSPLHITGTWLRNHNGYITSSWDIVRKGDLVEYGDYVSWWGYRPVSWIVSFYPCK